MRRQGVGGGGRERNWQAGVVDKCRRGASHLQRLVSNCFGTDYRTFKRRLPISAVKHSLSAGLPLCQIEPVCLDGPRTSSVFSLWTFAILCSAHLAEKRTGFI